MAPSSPDSDSRVHLCAGVLPVWVRHLASSRTQSEAAVHAMLQAFSEINREQRQPLQPSTELDDAACAGKQGDRGLFQSLQSLLLPYLAKPEDCAAVTSEILNLVLTSRNTPQSANALVPEFGAVVNTSESAVVRMYKGFQYQDRISQMMALLEQDMMRLQKVISGPQADVTCVADWLARLEEQYAMAEQRTSHSEDPSASGKAASDETTFF